MKIVIPFRSSKVRKRLQHNSKKDHKILTYLQYLFEKYILTQKEKRCDNGNVLIMYLYIIYFVNSI